MFDFTAHSRGTVKIITVDNGSEFILKQLDDWAYQAGVSLDFVRPGKPLADNCTHSPNGTKHRLGGFSELADFWGPGTEAPH